MLIILVVAGHYVANKPVELAIIIVLGLALVIGTIFAWREFLWRG